MLNKSATKTTFQCLICKRKWYTKVYADFCEEQCRKGTPFKGTGIID